jgi:hypothetical protein
MVLTGKLWPTGCTSLCDAAVMGCLQRKRVEVAVAWTMKGSRSCAQPLQQQAQAVMRLRVHLQRLR